VFKADAVPFQAPLGFFKKKGERCRPSPKAKNDDLPLPAGIQVFRVMFHKGKGGGNIRLGFQGVHQQHAGNDRFQVPPAFDSAGNLHAGFVRKGDKVKRVAQPQVVAQERTGKVIVDPGVVVAHNR
jgi:hypothetical protein